MKPIPCKQCITFAICYNKMDIQCSIVCNWIRDNAFTNNDVPFNREGYDISMDELEKLYGRTFSSRTDQGKIWDRDNADRERDRHIAKRLARRRNANNAM